MSRYWLRTQTSAIDAHNSAASGFTFFPILVSATCHARAVRHVQHLIALTTAFAVSSAPLPSSQDLAQQYQVGVLSHRRIHLLTDSFSLPQQVHGPLDAVLVKDIRAALRTLNLPRINIRCTMCSSSPQCISPAFEPDSVYLVFITRSGGPCAGVFHHNSGNRGILAYADVGIPGPRRSRRKVFSFELEESKTPRLPSCLDEINV